MDDKTLARFWAKVDKNGPIPSHMPHLGRCWIWIGNLISGTGYGKLCCGGKNRSMHRLSFSLHNNGDSPEVVMHKCDNRACVNPGHLESGTKLLNNRDMVIKGRHRGGATSDQVVKGESHAYAKLTCEIVRAIRREPVSINNQELAVRYGVSRATIRGVRKHITWKHVA
jgi:hypothetical protein